MDGREALGIAYKNREICTGRSFFRGGWAKRESCYAPLAGAGADHMRIRGQEHENVSVHFSRLRVHFRTRFKESRKEAPGTSGVHVAVDRNGPDNCAQVCAGLLGVEEPVVHEPGLQIEGGGSLWLFAELFFFLFFFFFFFFFLDGSRRQGVPNARGWDLIETGRTTKSGRLPCPTPFGFVPPTP